MYAKINNKKYSVILCDSFFLRLKGLMFRKEKINSIYLFPKCSSIHTFFMKQDIDLCILDKDNKILFICSGLRKNKIILRKGSTTLEMPLDTAKYLNVGDTFSFFDK